MPVNIDAKTGAKRGWSTVGPLKDAELERVLERLDAIVRLVEPLAAHIEERLGVLDTETEEEQEDSDDESSM